MTDTITHRRRTLTITKGPPKDHRGLKQPVWLGRYDGDASEHRADTRKELIACFMRQVDSDQLPLPEIDALFERWAASIKEMAPRVGLHAAMPEIMTLQLQMGIAQTLMRSQA